MLVAVGCDVFVGVVAMVDEGVVVRAIITVEVGVWTVGAI